LKTGKNRRPKQAKEEAQAEVEQYRLQREKEFKAKEAAVGPVNFHYCLSFLRLPPSPFPLRLPKEHGSAILILVKI